MTRRFQRRREDFECARCGAAVSGDGYTNHCPACLWSRHVDVFPGDRAADCGGPMRPVGLEVRGAGFVLRHRCERCGAERRNRAAQGDDPAALVALSARDPRASGG